MNGDKTVSEVTTTALTAMFLTDVGASDAIPEARAFFQAARRLIGDVPLFTLTTSAYTEEVNGERGRWVWNKEKSVRLWVLECYARMEVLK